MKKGTFAKLTRVTEGSVPSLPPKHTSDALNSTVG